MKTIKTSLDTTKEKKIRLFLVDNHLIVRAGLKALLTAQPDMDVCCFSWNWKNGRFELHSQGRTKGPELWKSPDDSSPAWRR